MTADHRLTVVQYFAARLAKGLQEGTDIGRLEARYAKQALEDIERTGSRTAGEVLERLEIIEDFYAQRNAIVNLS